MISRGWYVLPLYFSAIWLNVAKISSFVLVSVPSMSKRTPPTVAGERGAQGVVHSL
jgi:hypothetical protein